MKTLYSYSVAVVKVVVILTTDDQEYKLKDEVTLARNSRWRIFFSCRQLCALLKGIEKSCFFLQESFGRMAWVSGFAQPYRSFFFFFFFFTHFHFPASGQAVVTGVAPSPPRFLPSLFMAHRVQQCHCSSIFHRGLFYKLATRFAVLCLFFWTG